jgi:uncharacterized protein (TIGR00255 family)
MIHSMTAFARETVTTDQGLLTVELRSVNHRYLDCSFKLPDNLRPLEPKLRELAGTALARGKLDCLVRLQGHPEQVGEMKINEQQLEQLLAATTLIARHLPEAKPLNPMELLQYPGICAAAEVSEEQLQKDTAKVFARALKTLRKNRRREGKKLAAMILERLQLLEQEVAVTRKLVPALLQQQRDRVIARVAELALEVDQGRLEQELVHMSHKADVDEELDRLDAHVDEVQRALEKGGPCGRRLDFLMQELNREANTLSSKSISSVTTQSSVELKVLIEQMREQIQNIE